MAYNVHSSNAFILTDCGVFEKKLLLIWYNSVAFLDLAFSLSLETPETES